MVDKTIADLPPAAPVLATALVETMSALGVSEKTTLLDIVIAATKGSGSDSLQTGVGANAAGYGSSAYGWGSSAGAYGSSAYGMQSNASGEQSTALGTQSIASGVASTAIGLGAQALGDGAVALGSGAIATNQGEFALAIGLQIGDMIVCTGAGVLTRVPVGADGSVFTVVAGIPAWVP